MKRPAVFFDRDNTLIASDGYLGDPDAVVLIAGAARLVSAVRQFGFATVVVSNQSGVARGMFDEQAVRSVNRRVDELLAQDDPGAIIDRHEYCPDHPEASVEAYRRDSDRRKPGAGMLFSAAEALSLDLPRSWLLGDAPRDIAAGRAAGCRTILFADPALPASPDAQATGPAPDFVVSSLAQALDVIAANLQEASVAPAADSAGDATAAADPEHSMDDLPVDSQLETAEQILAELRRQSQWLEQRSSAESRREEPAAQTQSSLRKIESLLSELVSNARRPAHSPHHGDFSVSKLLAGIVQILTLAALFFAYLSHPDATKVQTTLLVALSLQTLTIALLIMGRQR